MPSLSDLRRAMAARDVAKADVSTIIDAKHPRQAEFVEDASRFRGALCGRRGGKSNGLAYWFSRVATGSPGKLSTYVAGSKGEARRNLLPALERVSRDHALGAKLREQDGQLMWCYPNGHRIWLAGCHDRSEVDKFRGASEGFTAAAVDEAQNMPFLRELVEAALIPALVDQKGPLVVCGTPHPVPAGYFYEITTGDGGRKWPTYHWTMLENPYIDGAGELEVMKEQFGWDDDHPTLRREWMGEWVRDEGALVYPYSFAMNGCFGLGQLTQADPELPEETRIQYGLGIDLGSSDNVASTSFTLGATIREDPHIWILKCEKRAGLIPSAVAGIAAGYQDRYPNLKIVIDEGGLGGGYAREMRERHGIPCEPAKKTEKRAYQEMMGGDMKSGVVRVLPRQCQVLIDEWSVIQWREDKSEEDPRFVNHAADGALYLWRALRPVYHAEREVPPPTEQQKMRAAAIREAQERQQKHSRTIRGQRELIRRAVFGK